MVQRAQPELGAGEYKTTFSAVWSNDGLFLLFDAVDHQPWTNMTRRDDHLWDEEVVEIFLDRPAPAATTRSWRSVPPTGHRVANGAALAGQQMDLAFDLAGLETRVHPLRDASGKTTGWTAVAFIPWSAFRSLPSAAGVSLPPRPDDRWRFNLFRIERPGGPQAPARDAVMAAWSDPGGESFHVPAAFRDLVFAPAR